MIRPLTIVTFLMACGSGLYLYQSKHEAQVLDREIEKTIHDTAALREQSRLLAAEWTMLNDPDTLRKYADTYLSLKTISPTQFTSMADLDSRLPAVQVETPTPTPATTTDDENSGPAISEAAPPDRSLLPAGSVSPAASAPSAETAPAVAAEEPKPPPSHPAPVVASAPVPSPAHPVKVAVARPVAPPVAHAVTGGPEQHAFTGGPEQHTFEPRLAEAHPSQQATEPRPGRAPIAQPVVAQMSVPQTQATQAPAHPSLFAPTPRPTLVASAPRPTLVASAPRPVPVSAAVGPTPAQPQYAGSLLGMARGAAAPVPVPRPMPVSTAQWSNAN